jgi:hypothetical protein
LATRTARGTLSTNGHGEILTARQNFIYHRWPFKSTAVAPTINDYAQLHIERQSKRWLKNDKNVMAKK